MRIVAFLTLLATIGCGESTQEQNTSTTASKQAKVNGEVVATVNGAGIGSEDFAILASRKTPANGESLTLDERKEVLEDLITEELLYQEAVAKGYDLDPKVKKVMINALIRAEVYDQVKNSDFSDAELEAYYNAHKDEFTVPEKVQIYSIVVKTSADVSESQAKEKADRIYTQLRKDVSQFREIAKTESDSPYKRRGGDIGFVPATGKPGLEQSIVDKAFTMKLEELSEPFLTDGGWNIIYIPSKREAKDRSFKEMKGSVLRKVKNDKVKEMYDAYTGSVRTGKSVSVDDAKLQTVTVKASKGPQLGMPDMPNLGGMEGDMPETDE